MVTSVQDKQGTAGNESPPEAMSRRGGWFLVLAEVAALYGVIVLIEFFTGDGRIGAFGVHPHPYWLVILPMAAGRGLTAGLTAAACATLLVVFGAQRESGIEDLRELLTFKIMLEPILFFAVSFLIGEFRDIARDRLSVLTDELAKAGTEYERVRQQRDVLSAAGRVLERRLVDQNSHFGNLIETASRTELASPAEIREIALELVEEYCGASASVLMPRLDGQLELLCQRGWPAGETEARLEVSRESEYVQRAIREGREINGFSSAEEPPENGPLVVTPLTGAPGVIDALLCLDDVPASVLNGSTIRTFKAIARWTSALLTRSYQDGAPVSGGSDEFSHLEPSPKWIGSAGDLGVRLGLEYDRTVRHGLPLSFLAIRIRGTVGLPAPRMAEVDEFMVDRFATRTRASDALYRFPQAGCYLMVLPGTPADGAQALRRRLVPEQREEWEVPGEIEVDVFEPAPGTPDPDSLVEQMTGLFAGGEGVCGPGRAFELPAGRHIGTIREFLRTLIGEIGLAMRNEYPLQVISIRSEETVGVEPGLLAFHIRQATEGGLRQTDSLFALGEGHVVAVLPKTDPEQGTEISERLLALVGEAEADPPYGPLATEILSFGPDFPYYVPFIDALSDIRPLRDIPVAGGYR